jgi:hypothetical protein
MKVKVGSFKKQVRASNDKEKPAGEPSLQDTPLRKKFPDCLPCLAKRKKKLEKPINQQVYAGLGRRMKKISLFQVQDLGNRKRRVHYLEQLEK